MIVIDSSAAVAIILAEPEADRLAKRIEKERVGQRVMSTASYLEIGTVLAGRARASPLKEINSLEGFLSAADIDLVPVDADQARIALQARIKYGRGFRSGAQLNFGDCCAYALAKVRSAPLLYVGSDFDKTDIERA